MPRREDLQRIVLSDFRPGVASGWVSAQADESYPDGFAQEDDTFGCYGLPTGGLAPLPRITYEIDGAEPSTGFTEGYDWPLAADGYPEDYDDRIAVLDMHVVSPVHYLPPLTSAIDPADDPVDVLTIRQWWMVDGDGEVNTTFRFKGFPAYAGDAEAAWVQKHINARTYVDGAGLSTWKPHSSRWLYGWGSITETRTQSEDNGATAAVYTVGPPVVVFGMGTPIRIGDMDATEGIEGSGYWTYPDFRDTNEYDLAIASDSIESMDVAFDGAPPGVVFGHQGRLCSIGRAGSYNIFRLLGYHGSHHGQRALSEIIAYWPTNAVYSSSISWATFLEESTTGYGSFSSVNANQLLLIKNKGGGVLVSGDIGAPQVTRLPGLPSVGGLANRGVMTQRAADGPSDQGYVYGTSSGVWMWTGSDSAVELSANLSARFWVPDDLTIARRQPGQLIGSFAFSFPYLYAPNNWVYDMRGGGWWRYHPTPTQDSSDGTTFAFNETDSNGNLWAMPASYKFDTRLMAKFDQETPRDRWQWKSQPISRSRGRLVEFSEVEVVGAGKGRITVDVIGFDGQTERAVLDNTTEQMASIVQPIGLQAKDAVVLVRSEAYDPADPAPTLHRLDLGYRDAQGAGGQR